jgi:hypothetical protein
VSQRMSDVVASANVFMLFQPSELTVIIDRSIPGEPPKVLEAALDCSLESDRLATILVAAFATATLLPGIIAVHGVVSYWVRRANG